MKYRTVTRDGRRHYEFDDGTLLPVIAGGAGDEDPPEEEEEQEEEEEEEEEPPPPDEKDETLGPAGKKALEQERQRRKELERENKKLRAKTEGDQEKALREARESEASRHQGAIARMAFRTALIDAGLTTGHARLVKMLDLADVEVEVDDDGEVEVTGLDDQVKDLKKDFPELFSKKSGVGGKGDAGNKVDNAGGEKKSTAEKLAAYASE